MAAGLLLLAVIGTYRFLGDDTLVGLITERLEAASGTRIRYLPDATITRTLEPSLSLNDLVVEDGRQRYSVHVDSLQIQVSLPALIFRKLEILRLVIGDTRVEIRETGSRDTPTTLPDPPDWRLVLHDVRMSQISVVRTGEEASIPAMHFSELDVALDPDTDRLDFRLEAQLATRKIKIEAALPGVHESVRTRHLPFMLLAKDGTMELSADGRIDFTQTPSAGVEGHILMQVPDLSRLPLKKKEGLLQGGITGAATMAGTLEQLSAEDVLLTWSGPGLSTAELKGRVDDLLHGGGLDLRLIGHLDQPAWLTPFLPKRMDALNRSDLSARISGNYDKPAIREIALTGETAENLRVSFSGQAGLKKGETGLEPENVELKGSFSAPTTRAARVFLYEQVWELGPIEGTADIRSSGADLSIENIVVRTRDPEGIAADLTGRVRPLALAPARQKTGLDLDVAMKSESASLLGERMGVNIPLSGPVKADFRIEGEPQALRLEQFSLSAASGEGLQVDAQGHVRFGAWRQPEPLKDIDLKIQARSPDTRALALASGLSLPELGALHAELRLHTVSGGHRIDDFIIGTEKEAPVNASLSGRAERVSFSPDFGVDGISLNASAGGKDTAALNGILDLQEAIPSIGAFRVGTRISGSDQRLDMDDLTLQAGREDGLLIEGQGRLGHAEKATGWGLQDYDLNVSARSPNSRAVSDLTGHEIPELGPINATAHASGGDRKFVIHDVIFQAGREDGLMVEGNGQLGSLEAEGEWRLREPDFIISARSPNSRVVSDLAGYRIPELGPVTASSHLESMNGRLGLEGIRVLVGENDHPALDALGHIHDLFAGKDLRLDMDLNIDGHSLAAFADTVPLPDLQPLVGTMTLSDSSGTLGIDSLDLKSTDPELFSLEVHGRFEDFHAPETLTVEASLGARDLRLVGALLDREWPPVGPVQWHSTIVRRGDEEVSLDATMTVGETRLTAGVQGSFATAAPHISGKIAAQNFFFPDLQEKTAGSDALKKEKKAQIFSREPIDFSWLNEVDLDLSVDIESFDRNRSQMESARFEIQADSGQLNVGPATVVYPKGKIDFQGQIDARAEPRVSLKAFGKDINPRLALDMEQEATASDFQTDLDMDINLTSSGNSQHELASNMEGEIYMTLRNGQIRKALIDKVFIDVVGWSTSQALGTRYAAVECGVAHYDVSQGVLSTKGFFLETRSIAIAGTGTIDLGKEQIDYVFLPRKKSRLIRTADPVKLKGPLSSPTVEAVPWKSAVTTYGSLFFAPYLFVGMQGLELAADALNIRATKSPCAEYEKQNRRDW